MELGHIMGFMGGILGVAEDGGPWVGTLNSGVAVSVARYRGPKDTFICIHFNTEWRMGGGWG
jgi:hypothetical protein